MLEFPCSACPSRSPPPPCTGLQAQEGKGLCWAQNTRGAKRAWGAGASPPALEAQQALCRAARAPRSAKPGGPGSPPPRVAPGSDAWGLEEGQWECALASLHPAPLLWHLMPCPALTRERPHGPVLPSVSAHLPAASGTPAAGACPAPAATRHCCQLPTPAHALVRVLEEAEGLFWACPPQGT